MASCTSSGTTTPPRCRSGGWTPLPGASSAPQRRIPDPADGWHRPAGRNVSPSSNISQVFSATRRPRSGLTLRFLGRLRRYPLLTAEPAGNKRTRRAERWIWHTGCYLGWGLVPPRVKKARRTLFSLDTPLPPLVSVPLSGRAPQSRTKHGKLSARHGRSDGNYYWICVQEDRSEERRVGKEC